MSKKEETKEEPVDFGAWGPQKDNRTAISPRPTVIVNGMRLNGKGQPVDENGNPLSNVPVYAIGGQENGFGSGLAENQAGQAGAVRQNGQAAGPDGQMADANGQPVGANGQPVGAGGVANAGQNGGKKTGLIIGLIVGGLMLIVIIVLVVALIMSSQKEEEVVVETTPTVTCANVEYIEKNGYSYDCDSQGELSVKNTEETFAMTTRVGRATLEDVQDQFDTLRGVWSELGYTAGELTEDTFGTGRQRALVTTLSSGEAVELVMFTMIDTDHLLIIETTDFQTEVDTDVMDTVATILADLSTENLSENDGRTLRQLAGQLTLLEEVKERNERDVERKADVDVLKEAVIKYQEANDGGLPTDGEKLVRAYISGEFEDPSGEEYTIRIDMYSSSLTNKGAVNDLKNSFAMHLVTRATCSGTQTTGSENTRSFAILYRLENGGIYCVDNQ